MVICGSYMFEFNVRKDMKNIYNKGGGSRESSGTCISSSIYHIIEN